MRKKCPKNKRKPVKQPAEKPQSEIKTVNDVINELIKSQKEEGQGRKYFDGKDPRTVIQKLEAAWLIDSTDAEAAFSAEISKAAISDLLKKYPVITERKQTLKQSPFCIARNTIINSLTDPNYAFKYMEKKKKDEFGTDPSTIIQNNMGITNETAELTDEQLIDRARAKGITIPASIMRRIGKKGK